MKKIKKIMVGLLASIMIMAAGVNAYAAEPTVEETKDTGIKNVEVIVTPYKNVDGNTKMVVKVENNTGKDITFFTPSRLSKQIDIDTSKVDKKDAVKSVAKFLEKDGNKFLVPFIFIDKKYNKEKPFIYEVTVAPEFETKSGMFTIVDRSGFMKVDQFNEAIKTWETSVDKMYAYAKENEYNKVNLYFPSQAHASSYANPCNLTEAEKKVWSGSRVCATDEKVPMIEKGNAYTLTATQGKVEEPKQEEKKTETEPETKEETPKQETPKNNNTTQYIIGGIVGVVVIVGIIIISKGKKK